MNNLNAEKITGKIKITLKNGEQLIGGLPCEALADDHIIFLPHEVSEEFGKKFQIGMDIPFEELRKYVLFIKKEQIESYEVFESKLCGFETENKKPLPIWFKIILQNNSVPGHLNVKYSLPESDKIFEIGELPIKNGVITLPITFVFLSYAKEDKEVVKFVMNKLHDSGVITWFDEKDLLPGDKWEHKIEESIEKADYVFIFLSSKSIDRAGYKNKELNYALNQYLLKPSGRRYIIPILLDDCNPPRELKDIHWLKISDENWIHQLMKAIGK